jgi:tetratricopeptide (TPR) repeat protein
MFKGFSLALGLSLLVPIFGAQAQEVVQAEGGVAAGRDIRNSVINIQQILNEAGVSEETHSEIVHSLTEVRAAEREASESAHRQELELLELKLGVQRGALLLFFRTLGEKEVPVSELSHRLAEIAARHKELLEQWAVFQTNDPAIQERLNEARNNIDAGLYDRADELLAQAQELDDAAIRMASELEAKAREAREARMRSGAATRARRGDLAMTRLQYVEAADHYVAAAERLPETGFQAWFDFRLRYAGALYSQGDEFGQNDYLQAAIEAHSRSISRTVSGFSRYARISFGFLATCGGIAECLASV